MPAFWVGVRHWSRRRGASNTVFILGHPALEFHAIGVMWQADTETWVYVGEQGRQTSANPMAFLVDELRRQASILQSKANEMTRQAGQVCTLSSDLLRAWTSKVRT